MKRRKRNNNIFDNCFILWERWTAKMCYIDDRVENQESNIRSEIKLVKEDKYYCNDYLATGTLATNSKRLEHTP